MLRGQGIDVTMKGSLIALGLLLVILRVGADSTQAESRLYKYLMSKQIETFIRPVLNTSTTTKINFGLSLLNFESLDETSGTLSLKLWYRFLWKDEYLRWDPAEFNGTTTIRLPSDKIWNPDITLYNRRGKTDKSDALAVVYSDGTVLHIPEARTTSHCSLDFTNFPYDTQTCILKFGSWTNDGFAIDLEFYDGLEKMDLSDYLSNPEWAIKEVSAKKNVKYYPCCVEPYPDLTFNLTMTRQTSYYTYIYVGPAVVLSLLVPFIFLLPPGDQQKITLGVGVLVCFTLFFMEMASFVPTVHGHTPLIDKYYMMIYVLVCVAMAVSTFISNVARRAVTVRHPPECIKKVLLSCLGRCLCVSYTMYADLPPIDEEHHEAKINGGGQDVMHRQVSQGSDIKEWLLIATVIDRLFFLIYVVLSILLTLIILCSRG